MPAKSKAKPKKITKAEYAATARGYYFRRVPTSTLGSGPGRSSAALVVRTLFNAVEAAIKSISAGRQNIRTAGWAEDGLLAHRRAAARIK